MKNKYLKIKKINLATDALWQLVQKGMYVESICILSLSKDRKNIQFSFGNTKGTAKLA